MVTALDKNTALILIDLQNGIVKRKLAAPSKQILEQSNKLIDAFHEANLPVIFSHVDPSGANAKNTRKDNTQAAGGEFDSEAIELVKELHREPQDFVILKHTWSAFYSTNLDEELRKKNITGIVLAGISTSIGVEGTARSAAERGYNITFSKDAVNDSVAEAHQNSLTYIFPRMGEVDDTDAIIAKLKEIK